MLTDKHAHRQVETLTQTTVAIVDHEIGTQGPSSEVVHAAGPVRHIPHHDGICLCEPASTCTETLISTVTHNMHVPMLIMIINTCSMPGAA